MCILEIPLMDFKESKSIFVLFSSIVEPDIYFNVVLFGNFHKISSILHHRLDLTLPPTPSTTPLPCEVAENFQVFHVFLYFKESVYNKFLVNLFLNSNLNTGPSDQMDSSFISTVVILNQARGEGTYHGGGA